MPTPKAPPWVCLGCYEPVLEADGVIEVFNNNLDLGHIGVFPVARTEVATLKPPNNDIRVYHRERCDPDRFQPPGFVIHTGQADTLEKWVWWTDHLFDKPWMGRDDLQRFLGYWWKNRLLKPVAPV